MIRIERKRRGKVRENIYLEVQTELFIDDGGNDRIRLQAYLELTEEYTSIGGVDIMPYPPNPLFSVVQHTTSFAKKGIELTISSALIGAAGPIVGECINDRDDYRIDVRRCIEAKMDIIADAAFECALNQTAKIYATE